jgi:hypothetical protein
VLLNISVRSTRTIIKFSQATFGNRDRNTESRFVISVQGSMAVALRKCKKRAGGHARARDEIARLIMPDKA